MAQSIVLIIGRKVYMVLRQKLCIILYLSIVDCSLFVFTKAPDHQLQVGCIVYKTVHAYILETFCSLVTLTVLQNCEQSI